MAKIRHQNHPIEFLREFFSYDPVAGKLYRLKARRSDFNREVNLSRKTTKCEGITYIIGRLIWALHTGEWPEHLVDHRDGDHSNNKWDNLRAATYQQNQFNKVGFGKYPKGVVFKADANRSKPWSARIRIDGHKIPIGAYYTMEEAAEAYRKAAENYQGEFAIHKSMEAR
jgi:hypothetical protein